MKNKNHIRKIVKNGRESYYINIPKEIIKALKWQEKQKLVISQSGEKLIIKDWPLPKKQAFFDK